MHRLNRENLALAFTLVVCRLLLMGASCFLWLFLVQLNKRRGNDLPFLNCIGLVIVSAVLKDVPSLLICIFSRLFNLFEFVLINSFDLVCYVGRLAYESLLLLSEIKLRHSWIVRNQSCGNTGKALSLTLLDVLPRFFMFYFWWFLISRDNWVAQYFVIFQVLSDFWLTRCYLFWNRRIYFLRCINRLRIQSLTRGPLCFFHIWDRYELMQLVKPRSAILAFGLTALSIFSVSFSFINYLRRSI